MAAMFGIPQCCCYSRMEVENVCVISDGAPTAQMPLPNTHVEPEVPLEDDEPVAGSTAEREDTTASKVLEDYSTVPAVSMPASAFTLELQLKPSEILAVEVARTPSDRIVLSLIREGAMSRWNDSREEEECRVREGDQIVEVNGCRNPEGILAGLKESSLQMEIHPRVEYTAVIEKEKVNNTLGLDVNVQKFRRSLPIINIKPGPLLEWNERNPERPINKTDQIVEINGVRGLSDVIFDELRRSSKLSMVIASFQ
eukprot:TRINITY_DN51933_c0_g1_i1.p1 TRINITY_DN51933_c0_g1~~TRINITY_DN51933_c0_g1_i1.p1  ORF type:complete len:270 (-),score=44.30 TRINITY_DN51933_c0_g1_i1:121-885(-)